jgi:hypothetical protein
VRLGNDSIGFVRDLRLTAFEDGRRGEHAAWLSRANRDPSPWFPSHGWVKTSHHSRV